MSTWEERFESHLAKDNHAKALLGRLMRQGFSRTRIILLLQAASDPGLKDRAQRNSLLKSIRILFPPRRLPPRKMVRTLADRLDKVAGELKDIFGGSLLVLSPHAEDFQSLAVDLRKGAHVLRRMPVPSLEKGFRYKVFWKHIPVAMLCKELDAPKSVPFKDIEELLYIAALAWGVTRQPADRALEMQVNRFMNRKVGRYLIASGLLDAMGRLLPRE